MGLFFLYLFHRYKALRWSLPWPRSIIKHSELCPNIQSFSIKQSPGCFASSLLKKVDTNFTNLHRFQSVLITRILKITKICVIQFQKLIKFVTICVICGWKILKANALMALKKHSFVVSLQYYERVIYNSIIWLYLLQYIICICTKHYCWRLLYGTTACRKCVGK